jgi:hypothetical protein
MPSRDEWIVIGLVLGALAIVGIGIFVLRKKSSPQRLQLKRVVLRNEERVEMHRDREGNLKELVIHREVAE